jgi:pimeloyl-ACP methyl ester carboxylesterase
MRTLVLGLFAFLVSATAAAQAPTRFTATVSGQGSDVVLIPGLASSAAVWDATVKQLAPSHRVHVLQVAGFAGAPAGPNGEGPMLAPLIEDIAAYVEKLDKPAIIGHSLGGLIALEVAAMKPDGISRVMAVDALPFYGLLGGPQMTVAMFTPQATLMRNRVLAQTDAAYAAGVPTTAAGMAKAEASRAEIVNWMLASDRKVTAKAMYEDAIEDARPLLPKITAKTTVLYAYDRSSPYPQANFDAMYSMGYAGLPGVTVKRIDDSLHFIMFDQPSVFAKEIDVFLR